MSEHEYNHPPLNQYALWNRPVAGEEQHNNVINVMEARRELDRLATHIMETGTPLSLAFDDLDHDTLYTVHADWDFIEREDMLLNRMEQNLAKEGIVFDPKWESVAYWLDEGGENT